VCHVTQWCVWNAFQHVGFVDPHTSCHSPPPSHSPCACLPKANVGLYIDATAHMDVAAWMEPTVGPATEIAATYLCVESPLPPKAVCGLQFSVLLSVAVRLATLLEFITKWGTRDPVGLPPAWLHFQMDGGHVLLKALGQAAKGALHSRGVATVTGMSDTVDGLWEQVRRKLRLPGEAMCPIIIDEAQVLAKTEYPHVADVAVRVPVKGLQTVGLCCRDSLGTDIHAFAALSQAPCLSPVIAENLAGSGSCVQRPCRGLRASYCLWDSHDARAALVAGSGRGEGPRGRHDEVGFFGAPPEGVELEECIKLPEELHRLAQSRHLRRPRLVSMCVRAYAWAVREPDCFCGGLVPYPQTPSVPLKLSACVCVLMRESEGLTLC
jgi:hypothetical protein